MADGEIKRPLDGDEGAVTCQGHEHLKKVTHDDVYYLPVDTLYDFLFSDSTFIRAFWETTKRCDIQLVDWEDDPDDKVKSSRTIKYTVPLNAPFGPKSALQVEKQICYSQSQAGVTYIVDCETSPKGIPYEDAFFIASRYCLTRVSKHEVRLRVTSEVRFRKNLFSVMKNMIDKTSIQGVVDYFVKLGEYLRRESDRRQYEASRQGLPRSTNIPKRDSLSTQKEDCRRGSKTTSREYSHVNSYSATQNRRGKKRAVPVMIPKSKSYVNVEPYNLTDTRFLLPAACATLVLLVFFNGLLFYKLWTLENLANVLYFPPSHDSIDKYLKQPPQSKEEWVLLLRRQRRFHEAETRQWERLLHTSLQVADKMRDSLEDLKRHVLDRPVNLADENFCSEHPNS